MSATIRTWVDGIGDPATTKPLRIEDIEPSIQPEPDECGPVAHDLVKLFDAEGRTICYARPEMVEIVALLLNEALDRRQS